MFIIKLKYIKKSILKFSSFVREYNFYTEFIVNFKGALQDIGKCFTSGEVIC